ncbi:ribbon-helix-helix protein, CopG family [Archaeoglobus sulfaticallidus]|nr:ribbon-helix-helix protein, CopG family [Archaeoglobus sulfaticallidus]
MSGKLRRLSVAIDEETNGILEELVEKENRTASEIIRQAITQYYMLRDIHPDSIKIYSDLLYGREYIILDIELWIAMLDELNEKASDRFWENVKSIAEAHSWQIRNKGFKTLPEILRFLEYENLFRVKMNGDKSITLVLSSRNEQKFMKIYLQTLLEKLGYKVKIVEGLRKILITEM